MAFGYYRGRHDRAICLIFPEELAGISVKGIDKAIPGAEIDRAV